MQDELKKAKGLPTGMPDLDYDRIAIVKEKYRRQAAERAGNLVPCPSAGPDRSSTAGRSSAAVSDFKKSRVSKRERMSTNYIW